MSVNDFGIEVLKKAAVELPGSAANTEYCLRVKTDPANPLGVIIVPGGIGLDIHKQGVASTTPGAAKTVITEAVPAGKTWKVRKVRVTTNADATYKVLSGATVIGSGRIGAGQHNDDFVWDPTIDVTAGVTIKVDVTARLGFPITDVEAYLMASEV